MRYHDNYNYGDIFISKNKCHMNIWKLVLMDPYTRKPCGQGADDMFLQREDNKYYLIIPKLYLVRHFTRVEKGVTNNFCYDNLKGKRFALFRNKKFKLSKQYKEYLLTNPNNKESDEQV